MTQPSASSAVEDDPLEALLGLEEDFYNEGFRLGRADGERAGRVEGRVFGFEKGFEKALLAGRLHGRCAVWTARLGTPRSTALQRPGGGRPGRIASQATVLDSIVTGGGDDSSPSAEPLPSLPDNPRLGRHLQTLDELVDRTSLRFQNDEGAISEFEDRLKRAEAKVKVIRRLVGETSAGHDFPDRKPEATGDERGRPNDPVAPRHGEENMEDFKGLTIRR